jgi:hypothetical protein
MLKMNGDAIDPASVPVEAGHDGADQFVAADGHEEQLRLQGHLEPDRRSRIVLRRIVGEYLAPKGDHRSLVAAPIKTYL